MSRVTVILEGGLVRDVDGADEYDVVDLDVSEVATAEELADEIEHADSVLSEGFPDREAVLGRLRGLHEAVVEWEAGR